MTPDMLEKALEYAKRGWAVLPVLRGSKSPYKVSKGVKDATTDTRLVRHWWMQTSGASIGIAMGEVSGVFALDIDARHDGYKSLDALKAKHGPLPRTVTAKTGGGGLHLLFRWPGYRVKNNNDGKVAKGIDVKGDGGYIVAAPSVHETGALYEWADGLSPDDLAPADAPAWLLDLIGAKGKPTKAVKSKPATADSSSLPLTIKDAIRLTLPDGHGQRHRKVFTFARALKAMPEYANAEFAVLKPLVEQWWRAALPYIRTTDLAETWADFAAAWPRVTTPLGTGAMSEAVDRAKLTPLPKCAEQYDNEKVRLLVKICRELQTEAGAEPLRLDCRTAGDSVDCDRTTALNYLNMLVIDGVLELVSKGTTNRASRYRYHGDEPESPDS